MKIDLQTERKLQEILDYFCRYKCDKQEIEDKIMDMLYGDIEDASLWGNVCDICKVKSFITVMVDELNLEYR